MPSPAASEVFSRRIHVAEFDPTSRKVERMMCFAVLLSMGLCWWWVGRAQLSGWDLTMAGMLSVPVFACAMLLWGWLERGVQRWRGRPALFRGVVQVDVDERGVAIEGLCRLGWSEVHSASSGSDSSSSVVLYSTRAHPLLLMVDEGVLCPVVDHWLEWHRQAETPA